VVNNKLLYLILLWKHADNEDGIFQSIFWLCEGWTSTRELTVKKGQVIIKCFRRSYEFWSSFCFPIHSVKVWWGIWTSVNFKKGWIYTTTPHTYIFMVSCLINTEKIYIPY